MRWRSSVTGLVVAMGLLIGSFASPSLTGAGASRWRRRRPRARRRGGRVTLAAVPRRRPRRTAGAARAAAGYRADDLSQAAARRSAGRVEAADSVARLIHLRSAHRPPAQ